MWISERLIEQNKRNKVLQKNRQIDAMESEPTQAYQNKKMEHINANQSTFASVMSKGINSEESIFDRNAVFRTKEG